MATVAPPALDFLGVRSRIVTTGEETNGALGVVEMLEMPPGDMPPLHVHHAHDECFYILDGEITFFLPGRQVELGAGGFLLAPRGIPHAYRVEETARVLVASTPAGFEAFVADVAALDAPDPARLTEIAAGHGIEILGPPGMLP